MTGEEAGGWVTTRGLVSQGEQAMAAGDLRRADRLLARATSPLPQLPTAERVMTLQLRAVVLMELAEYSAAERVLRRVLHLLRRGDAPVPDRPERLTQTLTALGTVLRLQARYRWAERVLQAAVATAADPAVSPQARLAVLNASAIVCKDSGRYDEAEALYARVLEGYTGLDGRSCDAVATACHNRAGLSHARGRYIEAEPWARRAVEVRLRHHAPDAACVLADRVVLAAVLVGQGREAEAEPIYATALSAYERRYGPDRYEVAVCHNGLAACRVAADDPEGALPHLRQALQSKRAVLGMDHPEVAVRLNNLDVALRCLWRHDEAVAAQRAALPVLESVLPPSHPTVHACRDSLVKASADRDGTRAAQDG
jgi:tetratricopeptide (TPR) repeat protein